MAEDWAANVKKYVPDADDGIIAGIVRYCGIALQKRDSSLVSFGDATETKRVRENFLKKKLALTDSDDALDKAIAAVGDRMKGENFRNRVTVYYLLAESFGKLGLFAKAPAKKASTGKAAASGAGAAAAAGGAAALGLASLGGKEDAAEDKSVVGKAGAVVAGAAAATVAGAGAVAAKAADTAGSVVSGTADAAGKAGAAVVGAAGAAATGAADLAGKAGSAVADTAGAVASGAADVADKAGAAVLGAAGVAVGAAGALAAGASDTASAAVGKLSSAASAVTGGGSDDDEGSGLGWLWWLFLALLALALLWWLFGRGSSDDATKMEDSAPAASASSEAVATDVVASAPAEGTVEIPQGAGVTTEMRDGKPVVKVYFDTGKTEVAPAFAAAAGGLKAWLEKNPGSSLAVSGYNDKTGNAAANAELSKNRAQAVGADLVKAGIAEASVALIKPDDTTDTQVDNAAARRVEVVVK